jgi:hypothetical protein
MEQNVQAKHSVKSDPCDILHPVSSTSHFYHRDDIPIQCTQTITARRPWTADCYNSA